MTSLLKKIPLVLATASILLLTSTADAANWFKLRGTEPGGTAHTLQMWGFLQPRWVYDDSNQINVVGGSPAAGLVPPPIANALNGTNIVPTTIPRERNVQESFYLRRARIGIRGTMLPINNDIDYFILTEWGQNGVTSGGQNNSNIGDGGAQLLDASVTLNQLSRGLDNNGLHNLGARFRLGQFLFSQTSESLSHSTPGRRVHMFFAESTFFNALRRRTFDNANGNFPGARSVNAARDIGIEVFDFAEFGSPKSPYEFTYSLGLGNGDTIGEQNQDDNYRTYAWLSFGQLLDNTRGPRRHDWMVYTWYQKGDILFNDDINDDGTSDNNQINPVSGFALPPTGSIGGPDSADTLRSCLQGSGGAGTGLADNRWAPGELCRNGNEKDYEQTYTGFGFEYFDKPFKGAGQIRVNIEFQEVEGFVFDGAMSPSSAFNTGVRHEVENGKNDGWYADFGYDIHQHWGGKHRTTVNLRIDEFNRNKDDVARAVHGEHLTFTAEYFFHKKARLTLTYQQRDWDTNDRTNGPGRPSEIVGNAILKDVGDRIGLELTFIFKNVLLR